MGGAAIPRAITTGCDELDLAWETFASQILDRPGVMIPDTDDDLMWHAFLGHSVDMQGWRAAEFVGVDELTKPAPGFVPLIKQGIGARELGSLWEVPDIRLHLETGTTGKPLMATLDVLHEFGGSTGRAFADSYTRFPWRKAHGFVRALLQNSAALADHDYSFRRWLQHECSQLGIDKFPPPDFRVRVGTKGSESSLESAIVRRLQEVFYQVGPTMAPYMICDWQLWLWNQGHTAVFEAFKPDAFHVEFVERFGSDLIPREPGGFARWWLGLYPELPPRLVNECIWLAVERGLVSL